MAKNTAGINKLLCKFGNLSIGAERCSIGVKFERANLVDDHATADAQLCGARVEAVLTFDPADDKDIKGQQKMPGLDTAITIKSVADVNGLNVKPDTIGVTLAFARSEFDDEALLHLALLSQKSGRLTVERVGDADEDDE